jgi:pSer/pThr/pTyr-binding forkhead associated (FHA) protein
VFEIIVRVGAEVIERRSFDQEEVNVGRGKVMDIRLAEPASSKHHAVIRREGDAYVLHDLVSTNGTWVNEERVRSRPLNDGDRIRIGSYVMEFRPKVAPAAPWMEIADEKQLAVHAVLGTTYTLGPSRDREQRERSANRRACLELSGGAAVQIENDVTLVGGGEGCTVRVPRAPNRISGVILRGPAGFSLVNLEAEATVGGSPLGERLWLKDGDRITLGKFGFTFKVTS